MQDCGPKNPIFRELKYKTLQLFSTSLMESVTIIFSVFRLVFVEIFSYEVRYTLIINKMRVVPRNRLGSGVAQKSII